MDEGGEEFTISGRILTQPQFNTPSGKAQMKQTLLPDLSLPDPSHFGATNEANGLVLALITARSYSQHNTVVYKEGDRYRGMPHCHCILLNPLDAARAGFAEQQRVTVRGEAGQLDDVEVS